MTTNGDIALLPIALPHPPVDFRELSRFVQTLCERCAFTDNVIRYVLFFARKPVVDGETDLYSSNPDFDRSAAEKFAWDPTFAQRFPELVEWFEALPFSNLHGVDLVTQTDDIGDHLDVYGNHNAVTYWRAFRNIEPRYYRVLFSDPNDELVRTHSFYVSRAYRGKKYFARLPSDTSTFALSSSTCYHGSVHNRGHYKTTGVVFGELDRTRHIDLIERSLARYGDLAIRFKDRPVNGPGAKFPYRGNG